MKKQSSDVLCTSLTVWTKSSLDTNTCTATATFVVWFEALNILIKNFSLICSGLKIHKGKKMN